MSDYPVVLLVEKELTSQDAKQVRSLHEELDAEAETVRYHVLLPVEDAAIRVEGAMGTLGTGDLMPTRMLVEDSDVEEMQSDLLAEARAALANTVAALEADGGHATGYLLAIDPVDGLAAKVAEVDAREAIILTSPHVVAGFFHRDWTSRARRRLGVPLLHLLEHETFDQQAGQGEGVTGL